MRALNSLGRSKPGPGHRGEERVEVGAFLVPAERDAAHQVCVCELEPLVALQCSGEPLHAALAADPADLKRLRADGHQSETTVRSATSAAAARKPALPPTAIWTSPSEAAPPSTSR